MYDPNGTHASLLCTLSAFGLDDCGASSKGNGRLGDAFNPMRRFAECPWPLASADFNNNFDFFCADDGADIDNGSFFSALDSFEAHFDVPIQ
jgi:hypothetical protein